MKLEQSFEVAAPVARVWEALVDVERVAPCLPGASVTGRNDDGSYTGEFKVKVGPTSAAYSGKLEMEEVDADAHRATMTAAGSDVRGQGGAKARIVSTVTAADDGATRVDVSTDYQITGRLARFGRGGMIEAISAKLLGEFASNLQAMLAGGGEVPAAAQDAPAAPDPSSDPDPGSSAGTPSGSGDAGSGSGSAASASEPLSAGSLVGSVVRDRVAERPAALVALVLGLVAGLGLLRRRRS